MNPPTIETDHLILRPFDPADADAYYEAVLSDPTTMRALPTGRPVPPQRARSIVAGHIDHWDEFGYGLWAVIEQASGQLIGHCGFQPLDQKPAVTLTYAIKSLDDSDDLPIEAARACLRYAFESLSIVEVVAVVLSGNTPARRTYHRLGMRSQGKIHAYEEYLPFFTMNRGDFLPDESRYVVTRGDNNEPAHP
jgi:ribosomal-protein-alanine N-acetyltransferase